MADLTDGGDLAGVSRLSVERLVDASGVVSFKVIGQLDVSTEAVLRAALEAAVREASTIMLDVSELDFMDSSGLAVLLVAAREVDAIELRDPSDIIRRVITIAGLTETLRMTPDA